MKLYHYAHCPFCIRVRMALGFLNIPFESKILSYDDEKTPLQLTGKKMLPIAVYDDNRVQNESLEIIKTLDQKKALRWEHFLREEEQFHLLLAKIGELVHSLAMPYWIWSPEFNEKNRSYFQKKKEMKRGPFFLLVQNQIKYKTELNLILTQEVTPFLTPFYREKEFSIMDLMLAAHLWGMYVVPEFQFSTQVHNYLMSIKDLTHFNYHEDFWKKES